MANLKISDKLHEKLKRIQASLYLRYSKTISQIEIVFHMNKQEIESEDHDKIADRLYNEVLRKEENDETKQKKTEFINYTKNQTMEEYA